MIGEFLLALWMAAGIVGNHACPINDINQPQSEIMAMSSASLAETEDEIDAGKSFSSETIPVGANMVNCSLENRAITFETFNPNSYAMKSSTDLNRDRVRPAPLSTHLSPEEEAEQYLVSEPYIPDNSNIAPSPLALFPPDDRIPVSFPKSWPYFGTALLNVTFNVGEVNYTYSGTGFLEGPDLMVTAAHCLYKDFSGFGPYGSCFASEIVVLAGWDNNTDIPTSSYAYRAEVEVANIPAEYFQTFSGDYDWAACRLDWKLGNVTGYYGKIGNWYSEGAEVFTYGYPSDKDSCMWEAHGNTVSQTPFKIEHDCDTNSGQSGSPLFMRHSNGGSYVCAIHAAAGETSNGGPRITSFVFHYLNSFVTNHNWEHSVGSISPDEYGFEDAYPTDSTTSTQYASHATDCGFRFRTIRYRTGYIHSEYLVMSCIRDGINEAFIEFEFEIPITKMEVQLSHWREREHEWLDENTGVAWLQSWNDGGWETNLDLLSEECGLPRDRRYPVSYEVAFHDSVTKIRFYEHVFEEYHNNNNRGRICIGDISFYAKEGNI